MQALEEMQSLCAKVENGEEPETIWLLEHPDVYTKGLSGQDKELINPNSIPVVAVGRGGKFTYHGPGQRIIYPILNLNKRQKDLRLYIQSLEEWVIVTLQELGLKAFRKPGFIGIWTTHNQQDQKIAAIGVRVSKWVTSHGIALNVNPNLSKFRGIIPCGITNFGVTSLQQLGLEISFNQIDEILQRTFKQVFSF